MPHDCVHVHDGVCACTDISIAIGVNCGILVLFDTVLGHMCGAAGMRWRTAQCCSAFAWRSAHALVKCLPAVYMHYDSGLSSYVQHLSTHIMVTAAAFDFR